MNAWSRYKGWSSKGKDGFRWGSCCRVVARRESFFFWLSHWEADDRTYEKPPAVFARFAGFAPQAPKRHRLTQLPANDDASGRWLSGTTRPWTAWECDRFYKAIHREQRAPCLSVLNLNKRLSTFCWPCGLSLLLRTPPHELRRAWPRSELSDTNRIVCVLLDWTFAIGQDEWLYIYYQTRVGLSRSKAGPWRR